jgi:hypothetical protein
LVSSQGGSITGRTCRQQSMAQDSSVVCDYCVTACMGVI